MTEVCTILAWDTDFFGCRIGRVQGNRLDPERSAQIDAWARTNQIDCLYFLADADHAPTTHLAEQNGYHLQDVRLTLDTARPLDTPSSLPDAENGVYYRPAQTQDVDALSTTVRAAYTQSRFFHDPRFPDARCADFYETWLRRSILERYADHVLVAANADEPLGFVTCDADQSTQSGQIGLIGVSTGARGQGIAGGLVQRALGWFWAQGMQRAIVVTQGRNITAQRLYQRFGFRTHDVALWYHRWYTACQPR